MLVWLTLSFISVSYACSCMPTTLYQQSRIADIMVQTQIYGAPKIDPQTICYSSQVIMAYKGPFMPRDDLIVCTSVSSATCGISLTNDTYILSGSLSDAITLRTGLCRAHTLLSDLTEEEASFLNTIWNNDLGSCATGNQLNCFLEPCSVSSCDVDGAVCEDAYCNGCNAYWWSNNNRVCFNSTYSS
eukprot:TRINITY_DN9534_c0_g1_i1.p1 TRINITY_DN9534_c0_g1~~TRINITY_DN9534_c0_g1_i1.p1  ORF type:complete len:187 (-),score=16.77 TRINITY_DN9534_c0_g1_i1:38-598(-)